MSPAVDTATDHETSRPAADPESTSRLPGFYELPISVRAAIAARFGGLDAGDLSAVTNFGALSPELVDVFIENGVGSFALPLGVATNFLINGYERLIPMAVEETSVLAAASHGAKLARKLGGFRTKSSAPVMIGQIQVRLAHPEKDFVEAERLLTENRTYLLEFANRGQDRLVDRGGGALDLTWRRIPELDSLILHLHVDTREAMGANIVNTLAEKVATVLPSLFDCELGLRILTNFTDERMASAECFIPPESLASPDLSGSEVIGRIIGAYAFAFHDVYRATTHNKGVMNGIDPILIATGNDWRAVEAGCHAYACRDGVYRPLTRWSRTAEGYLHGQIELPIAVGTVGGITRLHPTARAALKILGMPSARQLAEICCSVGLAQNLAALRALSSEGIQRGHMSLHQSNLDLLRRTTS